MDAALEEEERLVDGYALRLAWRQRTIERVVRRSDVKGMRKQRSVAERSVC